MSAPHYVVGRRFESESYVVDADQIVAFAGQFDPQPFHVDATAAVASAFGSLIASGWHTASLTMKLLVGSGAFAEDGSGGTVGAGADIKWLRPVRAGDVLRVSSEILSITPIRADPDRCVVMMRIETRNQNGELVQILDGKTVVPRALTTV